MNRVNQIAAMITDDPDVFTPLMESLGGGGMSGGGMSGGSPSTGASAGAGAVDKPINSVEIDKQAREMGGNNAASDVLGDQLKQQQEQEQQQAKERQKILKPQFDQVNSTMSNMQTGVMQGQQAMQTGGEQFGALDDEMTSLNTLLGNLQKQI